MNVFGRLDLINLPANSRLVARYNYVSADQDVFGFAMKYNNNLLGQLWSNFRQHARESVVGDGARYAAQMVLLLVQRLDRSAEFEAKFKHDNAELLYLCRQVVRRFEQAHELLDMQTAVEELESMLYEKEAE